MREVESVPGHVMQVNGIRIMMDGSRSQSNQRTEEPGAAARNHPY